MKIVESNTGTEAIGLRQLREDADAVIAAVGAGKSFLVKRKSKAVFRIVPVEQEVWDTVVDFTEIHSAGVPIEQVIDAAETLKRKRSRGRQDTKIPR